MFLLSTAYSVSANLLPTEVLTAWTLQIEGEGVGGGCLGKMSHSIEIVMCLSYVSDSLSAVTAEGFGLLALSGSSWDGAGEV